MNRKMILEEERHSEFVLVIGSKGSGKTSTIERCLHLVKEPDCKTRITPGVKIECKCFQFQENNLTFIEVEGNCEIKVKE